MTAAGATPTRAGAGAVVLQAHGIVKRFGGVLALKGVSFDLRPGEIHSLCGENGAGKSTLIKVLGGVHPAGSYEGTLAVDGRETAFRTTGDAARAGISVIHQELALCGEMTVAENVFLGAEPRRGWRGALVDHDRMLAETRALLRRFAIALDPEVKVGTLGVGHRQLVEIVKALGRQSRVLVLDEPTAALSEREVAILLDVLRDLRGRGIACVYISHRLEEVFAISDRITVLRDGQSVVTLDRAAASKDEVIHAMVGRKIEELFPRRAGAPGRTLLEVKDLQVAAARGGAAALSGISLSVRAGEVLGIGGLMGAGRTELVMHLFGAWGVRQRGRVELDGQELPADVTPTECLARGLVLVSEDRKRYGLLLDRGVGFNLSLSILGRLAPHGLIDEAREWRQVREAYDSLGVRAPGLEAPVGQLSGGNQQKVVLGKAILAAPRVVLLDEPTRGIDVGAKVEVYETINRLTADGKAVVLISSELPELMGMSDRILMLHEGRPGGVFERGAATQPILMSAALGHRAAGVSA